MNTKNKNVKVNINVPGEPNVGIFDWQTEFDIGIDRSIMEEGNDEFRENVREKIRETFSLIHAQNVDVWFDDECPTCGKKLPEYGGPEVVSGCPD